MTMIEPSNDNILCIKTVNEESQSTGSFVYTMKGIPVYKIVSLGSRVKSDFRPGDEIICNSTGTKVEYEGNEYYIFKEENAAAVAVDK